MKIAYLILACNQPKMVARLVENISADWADIYIHVDKKSDMELFQNSIPSRYDIVFIKDRAEVNWMGYSVVKAQLILLKTASARRKYKYYKILSESCQPVKSTEYIYEFFKKNEKNIMELWEGQEILISFKTNYYFFIDKIPIVNFLRPECFRSHPLKYLIRHPVQILYWGIFYFITYRTKIARRFIKKRKRPNLQLQIGSLWWTLTHEFVVYFIDYLEKNIDTEKFFKYVHSPDEMAVHTILFNSKFPREYRSIHINWTHFNADHLQWVHQNKNVIFLRKFTRKDYNIFWNKFSESIKIESRRNKIEDKNLIASPPAPF